MTDWRPTRPGKFTKEISMSDQQKFWDRVSRNGDCWEWQGCKDDHGYGRVMIGGVRKRAHRYALIFATGQDPADLHALHSCDNPPCCNPGHLRWGTPKENMADRKQRRRGFIPTGAKHGTAKLTDADARRIKFGGESPKALMSEFGVAKSVIYHIRQGRSWTHIGSL